MEEQYIWIDIDGNKRYYKDKRMNMLHRLDGPAAEYTNGTKFWFVDGQLHRLDGPAREYADGDKVWFVEGKLHRLDGPAIEYTNGTKEWYVDDKKLSEEQFNALSAPTLELTLEQIAAKFGVDASKVKIKK